MQLVAEIRITGGSSPRLNPLGFDPDLAHIFSNGALRNTFSGFTECFGDFRSTIVPVRIIKKIGTYDYSDDGKDIVYLTKDATDALRIWFEYRKHCDVKPLDQKAVFINKNGRRFTEDNIKSMFKNYSEGKLTPHMMRHEYITVITRESGDITFAQEQARHKSSSVTMFNYDSGASRSLSVLGKL